MKPPLVLTFDDGLLEHATAIRFLLDKFRMRGTFFITPSYIGNQPQMNAEKRWLATKPQWCSMANDGHEVASHSYTHPLFQDITDEAQAEAEFAKAAEGVERITGLYPFSFAFPRNYCERWAKLARRYYKYLRTEDDLVPYGGKMWTAASANAELARRVKAGLPTVAMIHSVCYGIKPIDYRALRSHLAWVRKQEIPVHTYAEFRRRQR